MPTERSKANQSDKPAPFNFQFEGREASFCPGVNQLCEIEAALDESIVSLAIRLGANFELRTMRKIVAIGLSTKELVYSEEEAGRAIAQEGVRAFSDAFANWARASLGLTEGLMKGYAERSGGKPKKAATA